MSRRLWGGSNTIPLKTTAWEARFNEGVKRAEGSHTSVPKRFVVLLKGI